jgi:transcriptional regulator with XRE-family HTH domain
MNPHMRPGDHLRELRNRLGVTTRAVEELSRKIALDRGNAEFYISNAWLTQLENKDSVPSIYKLFSLAVIYRTKIADLFSIFDIDLGEAVRYQMDMPLRNTHLTGIEAPDPDKVITFPVRFDRGFRIEKTNLLSRMVEIWGEVPVSLIQRLDVRHCQYGYVGLDDYSMSPILRPGSFVQIDPEIRRISVSTWRTEFDRPIFFVELRDSYACSWCELNGSRLTLVPHPLSGCGIRQYAFPDDAEIIGQVTGVAMRLTPLSEAVREDATPKLTRQV